MDRRKFFPSRGSPSAAAGGLAGSASAQEAACTSAVPGAAAASAKLAAAEGAAGPSVRHPDRPVGGVGFALWRGRGLHQPQGNGSRPSLSHSGRDEPDAGSGQQHKIKRRAGGQRAAHLIPDRPGSKNPGIMLAHDPGAGARDRGLPGTISAPAPRPASAPWKYNMSILGVVRSGEVQVAVTPSMQQVELAPRPRPRTRR